MTLSGLSDRGNPSCKGITPPAGRMLPGVNGHKARPVARESSRTQAEIHARLGAAALQRYVTGPADRAAAEYATAMRELNLALSRLAADDPMRADVSFDLG